MKIFKRKPARSAKLPQKVSIYSDGAIRPDQNTSGLAAVVYDKQGVLRHWCSRQAGPLTCNEAEYEAAILALGMISGKGPTEVDLYSDSQIVVHQMLGRATARALPLKRAQARLRQLAANFERVNFKHIPRERNRFADALANNAAEGRPAEGWAYVWN